MIREVDENTITEITIEQMAQTPNPRLKQIMEAAVRHLHAFAREVDLTPEEWLGGIAFLTKVGQTCTEHRQEFVLLSDVLGLSALVNALHERRAPEKGTTASLLGPFYREDAPHYEAGESISKYAPSNLVIHGQVRNRAGAPVPDATVRIWQTDDEGAYDLQKRDPSEMDLRGVFHTDADGGYEIRTLAPKCYTVPMDGPVGTLVQAQARDGFRPAHIHFMISAKGHRELVTALYLADDPYIAADTVFGVSQSLVVSPQANGDGQSDLRYDFTLASERGEGSGRVGADPSKVAAKA